VVTVNAATAGIEVQAPLHGMKASGLGPPEQGDEALEFFSDPKSIYVRMPGLS
jgi:aldehyde dehydrogenase (NAD+)